MMILFNGQHFANLVVKYSVEVNRAGFARGSNS